MTDLGHPLLRCVLKDSDKGMLSVTAFVWAVETLQALYCPGL